MQADHYQGIDQIYTSEYKTSGSRFIGFLFPCDDPHSFEKSIKSYKEKFADYPKERKAVIPFLW